MARIELWNGVRDIVVRALRADRGPRLPGVDIGHGGPPVLDSVEAAA